MPRPRRAMIFDDFDDVLNVEEAAKLLKVDPNTIYAHVQNGDIPHWRLGRQIRIAKEAIREKLGMPIPGGGNAA